MVFCFFFAIYTHKEGVQSSVYSVPREEGACLELSAKSERVARRWIKKNLEENMGGTETIVGKEEGRKNKRIERNIGMASKKKERRQKEGKAK